MSVIGLIVGLLLIGLFGWLLIVNINGIVKQFKAKKQNKEVVQNKSEEDKKDGN